MSSVERFILPGCSNSNWGCEGGDVTRLGVHFAAIPVADAGGVVVYGAAFQAVGFWAGVLMLDENPTQQAFAGGGEGPLCLLLDPVFADVAIVSQQAFLNAGGFAGAVFHGLCEAAYVGCWVGCGWFGGFSLGARRGGGFGLVIPNDAANDEPPETDAYGSGQNDFWFVVHFFPRNVLMVSPVVCNGRVPRRQAGCMGVACG